MRNTVHSFPSDKNAAQEVTNRPPVIRVHLTCVRRILWNMLEINFWSHGARFLGLITDLREYNAAPFHLTSENLTQLTSQNHNTLTTRSWSK